MKKQALIFVLLISCSLVASSQGTFHKTYGGVQGFHAYSISKTTDGGYVFVSGTSSANIDCDFFLARIDSFGDTLWTRTFGGTDFDDPYSVRQTPDGGFLVAGLTQSFGIGVMNAYLIRTDANGDTLWTKTIGGTSEEYAVSMEITPDGGFVIAGSSNSYNGGGPYDVYMARFNPTGNLVWTKTFGDFGSEGVMSIKCTADSGFILMGGTYLFSSMEDILLLKTTGSGNLQWSKTMGGLQNEYGSEVQQTSDSGYIISGYTYSYFAGGSGPNAFLLKTDTTGNVLWTKTYGGSDDDRANAVLQTSDGGFILAGSTQSFAAGSHDVYLIKTDANGDTLWTQAYGGAYSEIAMDVVETTPVGYAVLGYSNENGGYADACIIKTDSTGYSSCLQSGTATVITAPVIQSTPYSMQTLGGGTERRAATQVGSGAYVYSCSMLNTTDLLPLTRLSVYPNPFSGKFTVAFNNFIEQGWIEIYNELGGLIYSAFIKDEKEKDITLVNSARGIYTLNVFDGKKSQCVLLSKE